MVLVCLARVSMSPVGEMVQSQITVLSTYQQVSLTLSEVVLTSQHLKQGCKIPKLTFQRLALA
jgi:hypothetical protein